MDIYRIETSDGHGPYRSSVHPKYRECFSRLGLAYNCLAGCKNDLNWSNIASIIHPDLHFGFESTHSLIDWWHIPELRREMYNHAGLMTSIYESDRIIQTKNQIVFDKKIARLKVRYSYIL